ncbi:GPR1/FUN34/yaaH family-domain-containing protein [Mycena haematopus]|nr:GPR1/FUN34/yaaH family-domain-containing protein [Mycena haematopus]
MSDIEKGDIGTSHRYTPRPSPIGNPASLGLFSFASTTFILSFYNVSIRGILHPNVVVGMALFCGGLAQLLAGMWEFPRGNAFGATAFTSYGAFWLSFATVFIPGSGIGAAYTSDTEFHSALGIYLFSWFIVTFLFFIVALRKSIAFIALFGSLSITFLLLGTGEFNSTPDITKAGGAFGIITAFIAYYIGLADLLAAEKVAIVGLPLGAFKHD